MSKELLNIQGISKSFYAAQNEINYILKDISLGIKENSITFLIGGNGVGKTTLFNIISHLIPADKPKGTITFNDVKFKRKHKDFKLFRLGIARLFQGVQVFENLSIMENMLLMANDRSLEMPYNSLWKAKKIQKETNELTAKAGAILLRFFGEESIFVQKPDTLAGNLSFGQKRLLSLAALLMGNQKLILLDEPTSGVHPQLIEKIKDIIWQLKKEGKTLFIIEHNMKFVREMADHVLYLGDHTILFSGTPAEVLENPEVKNNYLGN